MKRLFIFSSLVITVVLPMMTSSTHHKRAYTDPLGTLAFAGHMMPNGLSECSCELNADGICPCCGATLCNIVQATDKHARHSGNQVTRPSVGPSSLGMSARTLLSLAAFLSWLGI